MAGCGGTRGETVDKGVEGGLDVVPELSGGVEAGGRGSGGGGGEMGVGGGVGWGCLNGEWGCDLQFFFVEGWRWRGFGGLTFGKIRFRNEEHSAKILRR